MVIVNRTWLKLAVRTQCPATVKWAASIVLNKLQKSGKAKYHTVTFQMSNDQEIIKKRERSL